MTVAVYIIVTSWNGRDELEQCLDSIRNQDYPLIKCIVVDNNSTDGTPTVIREKYPDVQLLDLEDNLGFSEANNLAIKSALAAHAEYVMLVNHDVCLSSNTVSCLYSQLSRNPRAAMAGPLIYFFDDKKLIWWAASRYDARWNSCEVRGLRTIDRSRYIGVDTANDWIPAACVLVKSEAIRNVGLFDKRFFYQIEDIDWGLRFRDAGYSLLSVYNTCAWHKVGIAQKIVASPIFAYYTERNRLLLSRLRQGTLLQLVYLFRRLFALTLKSSALVLPSYRIHRKEITARWLGVRDALQGHFGQWRQRIS